MTAGVYFIKSLTSGNMYIGSSANIASRWERHRSELRTGKHHSPQLLRAVARRGLGDLEFGVLLICDAKNALMYEQIYLDIYKPAYNSAKVVGKVDHTPEVRAKLSAAAKARWADPERKAKYLASYRQYNDAPETRAAMSKRTKDLWNSHEYREKMVAAHRTRCRKYEAFGRLWSLKEAAEHYGIGYTVLKNRLQIGWDLEKALTTPKRGT